MEDCLGVLTFSAGKQFLGLLDLENLTAGCSDLPSQTYSLETMSLADALTYSVIMLTIMLTGYNHLSYVLMCEWHFNTLSNTLLTTSSSV